MRYMYICSNQDGTLIQETEAATFEGCKTATLQFMNTDKWDDLVDLGFTIDRFEPIKEEWEQ